MMRLDEISILNFKNIAEAEISFCPGINCLIGDNGMGKSNMLEGVYYLSMMRSFLRLPDSEVIRHGQGQMMLRGRYTLESGLTDSVSVGYEPPRRKVLRRGGKELPRLSAHIGTLPVVLIAPQDQSLIIGAPAERRTLMDTVLSQGDAVYLEHLMAYNRALQQRNAALRAERTDRLLIQGLNAALTASAAYIMSARAAWVQELLPSFTKYYDAIATRAETPQMTYQPSVASDALADELDRNYERDRVIGHTTVGPHRDDLGLSLGGYDLRRLGSQGQMKTYTVALRLAIFHYLHRATGQRPLLLMDDIFDKLDAERVEGIIRMVSAENDAEDSFGQIFITDTGREHIDAILRKVGGPYLLMNVADGRYTTLSKA